MSFCHAFIPTPALLIKRLINSRNGVDLKWLIRVVQKHFWNVNRFQDNQCFLLTVFVLQFKSRLYKSSKLWSNDTWILIKIWIQLTDSFYKHDKLINFQDHFDPLNSQITCNNKLLISLGLQIFIMSFLLLQILVIK